MKTQNKSKSKSKVPKDGQFPEIIRDDYQGSRKLQGKKAVISGGDSGIGQAVAVHFAREGADLLSIRKVITMPKKPGSLLKKKVKNVF